MPRNFRGAGVEVFSIRMSRVIADRVAHLNHESVVGRVDADVGLGMAVLESHEREFRGRPRDVGGSPSHLAGDWIARVVDHKVREAMAGFLAANAHPPDLRKAI